jgi:hypothetical protein
MTGKIVPIGETVRRTVWDRDLLMSAVEENDLVAPYTVRGGPLGDSCESLRDLVAHVLMWDEINLAVLAEAHRGRSHWSLDPGWETPEAGRSLNLAGVLAGREVPVELLLHRFTAVRDALVAELSGYADDQWAEPLPIEHPEAASVGALAQYVMTVPGNAPYWHAAIHLGVER